MMFAVLFAVVLLILLQVCHCLPWFTIIQFHLCMYNVIINVCIIYIYILLFIGHDLSSLISCPLKFNAHF